MVNGNVCVAESGGGSAYLLGLVHGVVLRQHHADPAWLTQLPLQILLPLLISLPRHTHLFSTALFLLPIVVAFYLGIDFSHFPCKLMDRVGLEMIGLEKGRLDS